MTVPIHGHSTQNVFLDEAPAVTDHKKLAGHPLGFAIIDKELPTVVVTELEGFHTEGMQLRSNERWWLTPGGIMDSVVNCVIYMPRTMADARVVNRALRLS